MSQKRKKVDNKYKFFGLKLFGSSMEELLLHLEQHLQQGKELKIIFTPNPEQIVQAQVEPEFQRILEQATILLPDGMGLVWASRLFAWRNQDSTAGVKHRLTGIDVVAELLQITAKLRQQVLIIGGRNYTHLPQGVTWTTGYSDITQPTQDEEEQVAQLLKRTKPDLVLVALGAPWQEKWIWSHRQLLEEQGVKIAMVIGGAMDVLTGKVKRAPFWVRGLGLEWLYRLVQEPWRWRRQLRLIAFIKLTFQELVK